ncbi:MAG TPA: prolyl oligopeptidase family serine peptidase [Pyrinomonadaceae bacterium]|nr:prolyl oligopeptidase family serine peptidase [Pyrinomonadaceae bacterium]
MKRLRVNLVGESSDCDDQLAGRSVSDPYRWMEEDTPALRAWVMDQHEYTMAQLSSLPAREGIRRRLEELMRTPAMGTITKAGGRYFFRQRFQDQELSALYCQDAPHSTPRLLLDPSELSSDGTITLADTHPSCDGSLVAYRLSLSGSSHMSLYVMNADSKEVLPDIIPGDVNPVAHAWHTRNRVAWVPDNSGFYYTRCLYATPNAEARFHHKLYFHHLGDDWRDDRLVFGESLKREQTPYPQLSADGRHLVVVVQDVSGAAPRSELYLLDREDPQSGFHPVVPFVQGIEAFITAAFHRDRLYIQTNHEAPLGKLTAIKLSDIAAGEFAATTVIPEGSSPLGAWATVGNYLFVEIIEDVSSRLRVYDLAGRFVKQIELPGIGSINALSAEPESEELLISFSSFLKPKALYRMNLQTLEYALYHQQEIPFEPEGFEVEQVWFESLDQTRVPMFLLHKKGTRRDGTNAVVVHGYGGFGVSLLPAFKPHVIPFLERGGIYAVVNARGGGEFGAEWHRAGMREHKQNVFDDFIAAGEWLIAEGYTQASRLGCFGWSNGGLMVNAVAVQRPDLWKAVVAGAPVTDMARFHMAHGGRLWVADYGSPEDSDDLDFLMQYSPYHTLPQRIEAPAILTVVPDNDDRVAPWHSYKMHGAWLAANVSKSPILLRGEEQAGHRGSPVVSRTIARYADIWAFFFWQLGLD